VGLAGWKFDPTHVGCYEPSSFSTFAFTAASISISGGPGAFEVFAGEFLRCVDAEFAAADDFAGGAVEHVHTRL